MPVALQQDHQPPAYCHLSYDYSTSPTGEILRKKWTEPSSTWRGVFNERMAAVQQVIDLARLEAGWDTYNAPEPSHRAMENASRIISFVEGSDLAALRILPSADGGVALCFIRGDRYADLECANDGDVFGVRYVGKETPVLIATDASDASIKAALKQIQDHIRG